MKDGEKLSKRDAERLADELAEQMRHEEGHGGLRITRLQGICAVICVIGWVTVAILSPGREMFIIGALIGLIPAWFYGIWDFRSLLMKIEKDKIYFIPHRNYIAIPILVTFSLIAATIMMIPSRFQSFLSFLIDYHGLIFGCLATAYTGGTLLSLYFMRKYERLTTPVFVRKKKYRTRL